MIFVYGEWHFLRSLSCVDENHFVLKYHVQ